MITNNTKRLERIKSVMKELKLTQVKLAKDIGVQQSHVSRYLTGGVDVSDGFCYNLILQYGINPQWLENGEGEMFASASASVQGDDEIVMGLDSYMHMSEDLKAMRADLATFRTIIADQRKRIAELESQVKNSKDDNPDFNPHNFKVESNMFNK